MDTFTLSTLENVRDWVIIIQGLMFFVFTAAAFVVTVFLGLALRNLMGTVKLIVVDDVKPAMESAQATAATVRGTTIFVSETTIRPIIRTYGIFAGGRRALAVLSGLSRRRKDDSSAQEDVVA